MADDVVAPEAGQLAKIGQSYLDRADDLGTLKTNLEHIHITPGSFESAASLKTTWDAEIGNLTTFLGDLRDACQTLGWQLKSIADKYTSTDNLNDDDAAKVDELISAFEAKFPGVRATVPIKLDLPATP